MAPRRPKAKFANRGEAQLALKAKAWEKTNDQVDRCCRPCHSRRNVGASHVARAASSARRNDHASRLRMRSGQDTGWWCLCGQNHQTPSPQVRGVGCGERLPSMALSLLRAVAVLRSGGCLFFGYYRQCRDRGPCLSVGTLSKREREMGILWTIIIGFIAGVIAKFLTPGDNEPSGFILTSILGIVGAFVATYLGQALGWYRPGESAGLVGGVVGAIIVLFIYGFIAGRRRAV